MSRTQLAVMAVLSGCVTIAMLAGGVGAPGEDAAVSAALRTRVERTVSMPPAPVVTVAAPAPPPAAFAPASVPADEDAAPAASTSKAAGEPTTAAKHPASAGVDAPRSTRIKHVFVIALAGHGFDTTFGPQSTAPFLATQLRPQGTLLTNYRSIGEGDLVDELAVISGQPPNDATRAGCPVFTEIPQTATPSKSGEIRATGCAFPNTVTTIADQLTAAGLTWRAYEEDLDKGAQPKATCRRPASNAPDDAATARPGDGYATRHNPFVYFHSLTDLGGCDADDGSLDRLAADLGSLKTTPNYAFVAPNLCNSGTDSPCVDGSPGGLPAADAFLATWVPKILASAAYRHDGLLIITFAGNAGNAANAVPGGDDAPIRNGTLLLSRFAKRGASLHGRYDPYALLRTTEEVLGLRPLARAAKTHSFLGEALAAASVTRAGTVRDRELVRHRGSSRTHAEP